MSTKKNRKRDVNPLPDDCIAKKGKKGPAPIHIISASLHVRQLHVKWHDRNPSRFQILWIAVFKVERLFRQLGLEPPGRCQAGGRAELLQERDVKDLAFMQRNPEFPFDILGVEEEDIGTGVLADDPPLPHPQKKAWKPREQRQVCRMLCTYTWRS